MKNDYILRMLEMYHSLHTEGYARYRNGINMVIHDKLSLCIFYSDLGNLRNASSTAISETWHAIPKIM